MAADLGVSIKPDDISVSHRLPAARGNTRPIIAKFVRRETKTSLMKNKKSLKSKDNRKNVYVDEDLTPLRAKLTRELRADQAIKRVWTIDGKIYCVMDENGKEVKKVINSPDDLLKVGWSEEKVSDLALYINI